MAVGGVVVLGVLAWLLGWSGVTATTAIEVVGASAGRQEQAVRERAGDALGTPLLRVDTDEVRSAVLGEVSIAAAEVTREWPSTIRVSVTPRVAEIVLQNPQGRLEVVDQSGVSFGIVDRAPKGVPLVTATGQQGTSREAMLAALSVLEELPKALRDRVSALRVTTANLVAFTMGSTEVTWGSGEAGARKAAVLQVLLTTKPTPRQIDVSAPDTPVTRSPVRGA